MLLASLDDDVKKILFPNLVSLDAAELRIQQMAPKYLRQVALHHILGQLQSSSQVKPEIRNTIRPKKCAKFLPMCLSLAKPADKELDPVRQYGLDPDNEEQAKFVREMQDGANKVREACYLKGYRTAVSEITEFLNEPVLWYTELTDYVTRTSFMTYWCGKETSDPNGLVNLRGKLQLLYQVAMEKTGGKEKLQKPEEVITTLTAHSMQLYLKNLAFDPTSIAALLEVSCLSGLAQGETRLTGSGCSSGRSWTPLPTRQPPKPSRTPPRIRSWKTRTRTMAGRHCPSIRSISWVKKRFRIGQTLFKGSTGPRIRLPKLSPPATLPPPSLLLEGGKKYSPPCERSCLRPPFID